MIKTTIDFGNFFDILKERNTTPVLKRALSPYVNASEKEKAELIRGYALYKAKVSGLATDYGKYEIDVRKAKAYYVKRNGETTATATAVLLEDAKSVEVSIDTNGGEMRYLKELREAVKKPSSTQDFIDFLASIGLTKLEGKIYFSLEEVFPRVKAMFPNFKELSIDEELDLLEDAALKTDGNVNCISTKIVHKLIEERLIRKLVMIPEKGDISIVEGNQTFLYYINDLYHEGERVKFITYSREPDKKFKINKLVISMSPMNMRDRILPVTN